MSKSAINVRADGRQGLLPALLAISAVWLVFWALVGGMFFGLAGADPALGGKAPVLCAIVFAPPSALLLVGFLGLAALWRPAVLSRRAANRGSRNISVEID